MIRVLLLLAVFILAACTLHITIEDPAVIEVGSKEAVK